MTTADRMAVLDAGVLQQIRAQRELFEFLALHKLPVGDRPAQKRLADYQKQGIKFGAPSV